MQINVTKEIIGKRKIFKAIIDANYIPGFYATKKKTLLSRLNSLKSLDAIKHIVRKNAKFMQVELADKNEFDTLLNTEFKFTEEENAEVVKFSDLEVVRPKPTEEEKEKNTKVLKFSDLEVVRPKPTEEEKESKKEHMIQILDIPRGTQNFEI